MGERNQHNSPLDVIVPPLFNALILGFPCSQGEKEKTLSILQNSLSQTVAERPYLAAEMVSEDSDNPPEDMRPGDLWLKECTGIPDIRIVVNDMTGADHEWQRSYHELRDAGMPPSALDAKLLAPLSGYKTSSKVMAVQANLIKGGCLLSVYFLHTFVDAWGACLILGAWSHNCRSIQARQAPSNLGGLGSLGTNTRKGSAHPLAQLTAPATPSIQVPSILQHTTPSSGSRRAEYERLKKRPELWQLLGLDWRDASNASSTEFAQSTMAMNTTIFTATHQTLAKLKSDAQPKSEAVEGRDEATPWISTKDALAALLWRSIIKARFPSPPKNEHGEPSNSIIAVAIDARPPLGIPTDYVGNVIFESMSELSISSLTSTQASLASIAIKLRTSLQSAKDPNRLHDAIALASSIPDVRGLTFAISNWVGRDLIVTSWVDMPYYEHEWGPIFGDTGKAEFFRMPKGQFEGICSVQPRHADGTIDVIVGLEVEQMKRLRADVQFNTYLTYRSQ